MKRVAVVILNWNGEKMLKQFLPSVISNITDSNCSIIIADNGSTDNSVKLIESEFPDVKLILLDKNYGFAGGYNRALRGLEEDYFFILNSDVELKSNPIPALFDMLESDDKIGAAMPKILSQKRPEYFEHAGAAGGYIDKYGFPFCKGRIVGTIERDNGQYDTEDRVFWATGAALFIRRDVYNELGGFDDDFFAHMEEIDLCWRVKNRGYDIAYQPRSTVYHVGGAALNSESPFKLYLNYRNNLYMLHKNLPQDIMRSRIFKRMIIDGLLATIYLLTGKFSYFKSVIKAHKDYKKERPNLDKKRESIRHKSTDKIYRGSIIVDYAKGNKIFSQLNISKFR